MTDKVDTRVSPALDPETYRSVEGYNEDTRGYVDDVVSVMNDIYVTVGKLADARELADANPSWTPENRVLYVSKEATKQKDRLARRFDGAVAGLDARIAHSEAELRRPVEQAAAGPLAAEVRAHFKTLDNGKRSALIREALDASDDATLRAVLGAQPFLSGMTAADREYYSHLYHAKKQPHLVARVAVMRAVREKLDRTGANGPVFHQAFQRVVGANPAEARAIDLANERALAALRIEPAA